MQEKSQPCSSFNVIISKLFIISLVVNQVYLRALFQVFMLFLVVFFRAKLCIFYASPCNNLSWLFLFWDVFCENIQQVSSYLTSFPLWSTIFNNLHTIAGQTAIWKSWHQHFGHSIGIGISVTLGFTNGLSFAIIFF